MNKRGKIIFLIAIAFVSICLIGEPYPSTVGPMFMELKIEEMPIRKETHKNALEQIREGNFTSLEELNEKQLEELDWVYNRCQTINNAQWIYADINADGVPELIWQEKDAVGDSQVHRILAVFTVSSEGCKRMVWDVGDTGEFYFYQNNNIIYFTAYLGIYDYYYYGVCECGSDGEIRVKKSFEVYYAYDLADNDSMDFLSQFDWAQEISGFDEEEGNVFYVIGTRLTDEENVRVLTEKDEWIEQFRNEIGMIHLEEDMDAASAGRETEKVTADEEGNRFPISPIPCMINGECATGKRL